MTSLAVDHFRRTVGRTPGAVVAGLGVVVLLGCGEEQHASNGTTCPKGQLVCAGGCIEPTTDPDHCGACGSSCPDGIGCFAGKCTSPGWLNQPRQAHALVRADDGKIYCIGGGYGPEEQIDSLASVEVYDPSTNLWTETAPLETPRFALGAAFRDGRLIAFGGSPAFLAPDSATALAVTEEYSPSTESWASGAALRDARADAAHAADTEGHVWLFWGWAEFDPPVRVDSVEVSGVDGKWSVIETQIDPTRGSRTEARAVTGLDGLMYVLGGGSPDGFIQAHVDVFDPIERTWDIRSEMPEARTLGAATLLPDGRILYAGGTKAGWTGGTRDVFAYDPANESWEELPPLPVRLTDIAAVTGLDGRVYVVGGSIDPGLLQLERVFVYDPVRNTWYE